MPSYDFSVTLTGIDHEANDYEERVYEAEGGDDVLACARGGKPVLDFHREASSLTDALTQAILTVRSLGPRVRIADLVFHGD